MDILDSIGEFIPEELISEDVKDDTVELKRKSSSGKSKKKKKASKLSRKKNRKK